MAKKRKRTRSRRLASSVMLSAPRKRRRSRSLTTAPRHRKRSRGMGDENFVKGSAGKIVNPMIGGSAGGFAAQASGKLIPESIFTSNPSLAPHEKLIKRGVGYGLSALAAKMGYPLVAAGIAAGTTVLLMQDEGVLQDNGPAGTFSGRRLQATRYARPEVLRDSAMLSDSRLLSEGANYMQNYQGQYLYESPSDEFSY